MTACPRFPCLTLRRLLFALAMLCIALLSFGYYLQAVKGLVPCPMCIVQRYCFVIIAAVALLGAALRKPCCHQTAGWVAILVALGGAFTAGRQSWLQWYPPEFFSCGRDPFSMINNIGLAKVIPKIFEGHGDCTQVDWTFLGGSIANWSFLVFCAIIVALLAALLCRRCAKK